MKCLGYLKATDSFGLILGKGGDPSITCYSDSDWASNPITRRSIGGHVVYFGTSIIVWTSKTQKGILALYLRPNQNTLRWLWLFDKFYFFNLSLLN